MIDLDASQVTAGLRPVSALGQELFEELLAVLNGKPVQAELHGHREFAIYRTGFTF
jgi:altronate dehydratase large subunit